MEQSYFDFNETSQEYSGEFQSKSGNNLTIN